MSKKLMAAFGLSLLVAACGSDSNKKGGTKNPVTPVDPITGKPYDPTLNPYNPNGNVNNPNGNIGNAGLSLVGSWYSLVAPGSMGNNTTARLQFSNDGRFSLTRTNRYNSSTDSVLQGVFTATASGSYLSIDLITGGNQVTDPKAAYPINNPGQVAPGNKGYGAVPSLTIPCIGRLQYAGPSSSVTGNNSTNQQQLFLRCAWQGGSRPQGLDGSSEAFARGN